VNPLTAIPKSVRRWLYGVAVLGPVLLWTKAHGWTGQTEIDLWDRASATALGFDRRVQRRPTGHRGRRPPSKVTVEPLDPIVSSEGVTYPQSSDTKSDAADYDPTTRESTSCPLHFRWSATSPTSATTPAQA
jgi:hypothetical protein